MIRAQLENEGYDVIDFENMDYAYDFIGRCDIVVIDLMDSGYTIEKLKVIKEKIGNKPILILRGAVGFEDIELKRAGFKFILRRPFSIGQLIDEIKNVLDKTSH